MSPGLVSIIIPSYNAEIFIKETLESVFGQTYNLIEVIIIDDGSTDNTSNLVKKVYGSRVKYFYQENKGVSAARNLGYQKSKGEYVLFLDSDDIIERNFLKNKINALSLFNQYDYATGEQTCFGGSNRKYKGTISPEKDILCYNQNVSTCPSNYLFRSKAIKNQKFEIGLQSTADKFFLLSLPQNIKGIFVLEENDNLLYRVRTSSMSGELTVELVEDNCRFYRKVFSLKKENNFLKKFQIKTAYILAAANIKIGRPFHSIKWITIFLSKKLNVWNSRL